MSSASEAFVNVAPAVPRGRMIYRHTLLVRFTHWINAICLAVLLMSGLQIFNAHPALYWGNRSEFDKPTSGDDRARRQRRVGHKGRHDDPRKILYDNRGSRGVAR